MTAGRSSLFTVMVGVAMACGFTIALVFQATADQIERNRIALLEQAVTRVLPGIAATRGFSLETGALTAVSVDQAGFIAGYNAAGELVGVALPARIMGYQDTIRMLLGYDPATERLTGFVVLESRETPGLGSKIGTDSAFLTSLSALDVSLIDNRLANEVILATRGAARQAWQVDGITGATISSNAVVQAINNAAIEMAAIRTQLEALRDG